MTPKYFKSVRKQLGWNMETLANYMGYKHAHISLIESGKRNITDECIKRLINSVDKHDKENKKIMDDLKKFVD